MTVKELKEILSQLDEELEVVDSYFEDVEEVRIVTWTHTNYPYNLPDKKENYDFIKKEDKNGN